MIPLSSRDEARLFLQDLESNPEFPLKTRQEASVPLGLSSCSLTLAYAVSASNTLDQLGLDPGSSLEISYMLYRC